MAEKQIRIFNEIIDSKILLINIFFLILTINLSSNKKRMKTIQIKDKQFTLSIPSEDILKAVQTVGDAINRDLKDKNPLFICVLNGAFMFPSHDTSGQSHHFFYCSGGKEPLV